MVLLMCPHNVTCRGIQINPNGTIKLKFIVDVSLNPAPHMWHWQIKVNSQWLTVMRIIKKILYRSASPIILAEETVWSVLQVATFMNCNLTTLMIHFVQWAFSCNWNGDVWLMHHKLLLSCGLAKACSHGNSSFSVHIDLCLLSGGWFVVLNWEVVSLECNCSYWKNILTSQIVGYASI